jgi:hypothetical protein
VTGPLTYFYYSIGTFKEELQSPEVQENFVLDVSSVQLSLEDSATSGKLGKLGYSIGTATYET